MLSDYFYKASNALLLISAFIITASILAFQFKKVKFSLFLLFIGSLFLGFYISSFDHFLNLWDEQYHALVAKNMMGNFLKPTLYATPILEYDYRGWLTNHIWLHKQPLFLWQIALSLKLFGIHELSVRIPSILMHAILVFLIYRIGKITIGSVAGYYGALFFTVACFPLELVTGKFPTDHNDLAFLFYVTASFWSWFEYQHSKKKYWIPLIGVFSGCAVLVKWLVGLLIYAVWTISIAMNNKESIFKIKTHFPLLTSLAVTFLIFLPWQFFIFKMYPSEANYEMKLNIEHFHKVVENHSGNFRFHFNAISQIYGSGDAVPVLLLAGLFLYLRNATSGLYRVAIFTAILITYGFYTLAATKMIGFCIIVSPFAFLGLGVLTDYSIVFIMSKIKIDRIENIFRSTALLSISYMLINLTAIKHHHTQWRQNDRFLRQAELDEMSFIKKIIHEIPDGKYVVFNATARTNGQIPVMFYTNHIAYNFIPNQEQIDKVRKQSYKIAILDSGNLPDYICMDDAIIKIVN